MGDTWKALKIPKGLATNPILLALTLAPDGDLYCIGNDFNVYTSKDGGWTKPKQPTGTDMIGIAIEYIINGTYKANIYLQYPIVVTLLFSSALIDLIC